MRYKRSTRKQNVEGIDRAKLTDPVFTEEDWSDFHRGIELFNSGKFWHAHEAWEQVWRRHHEESRLFIQGLIQMAAAFHLMIEKKRYGGAVSNFNKAMKNLLPFIPTFLGLPVKSYLEAIEKAKKEIQRIEEVEGYELDLRVVPVILAPRRKEVF